MNNNDDERATKLLKAKDIVKMYPAFTMYSLNKAIKEERIPIVKIGNLNYFVKEDIEKYIKMQTMKKEY